METVKTVIFSFMKSKLKTWKEKLFLKQTLMKKYVVFFAKKLLLTCDYFYLNLIFAYFKLVLSQVAQLGIHFQKYQLCCISL